MKPLDNFQSKFYDEAIDNINEIENAILMLELSPNDNELVEQVFRSMHTLKGGGAMFGFEVLSDFTHKLENIYDLVRKGTLKISESLLTVTLNSTDLLRDLLDIEKQHSIEIQNRCKEITKRIDLVVKEETANIINGIKENESTNKEDDNAGKMATYFIHFYPDKKTLSHGTNLLYLLDELHMLGDAHVIHGDSNLPTFSQVNPTVSYFFWNIFLATNKGKNAIKDVFIFVEDSSIIEIHKLTSNNLFSDPDFKTRLNSISSSQGEISLTSINKAFDLEKYRKDDCSKKGKNVTRNGEEEYAAPRSVASSIRVATSKIDELLNLVSELVISQEKLTMISQKYQIPELKGVTSTIQKLTAQLRDSSFSISLIPIESLIMRFKRLVRDLSSELKKEVVFEAEGVDTELDKSMIDNLVDPILHIIRNSLDHGIESPEERKMSGKSSQGVIKLKSYYSGANVFIEISDDGKGLNAELIQKKAIEKNLIPADNELSNQELYDLVFLPGFSTNNSVSSVSGRGVGMDVVKKNISAIRGEVSIASNPGTGTTITISLPLVLSIIDGLLVRIKDNQYVIPLSMVDKIYPINSDILENTFNNYIALNGFQYSFFNLRNEMGINGDVPKKIQMVVINHHEEKIALSVDSVVGKLQAVLKPLGKMYHQHRFISAATIMGDGSIALVLDPNAIVKEFAL